MRGGRRPFSRSAAGVATLAIVLVALGTGAAAAIDRAVSKRLRETYEGRAFRLRVDLRSAAHAVEPNVLTLDGIGYGRETSPVLFYRLETVFVDRVTSEGGRRLSLTIYRSAEDARNLRATNIPPPVIGNPAGTITMGSYARGGSTTVFLELRANKKEAEAQRGEIDTLLRRLFYLDGDPSRAELEAFVLEHRSWSVSKLAAITGLSPEAVRALTTEPPPSKQ